jgi:beta-glucosidase
MIGTHTYLPSPPLQALRRELPRTKIAFDPGSDLASAAALAARSDIAIVFVTRHNSEGSEASLEMVGNQDALVAAVAKANPRTIVVAETGGAIYMPWVGQVPAILEAFYPGIRGGDAIARILTGRVNPSGHLPISFPASPDQLARPEIAGLGQPDGTPAEVLYDEGAAIGYKWYDVKGYKPLFWFGHGLSYTHFNLSNVTAELDGKAIKVSFAIRNVGKRAGKGVAQVYVAPANWQQVGWESPKRLGAFAKADLKPGQSKRLELRVDPRLLATYEAAGNNWHIKPGTYRLTVGESSDAPKQATEIVLPDSIWSAANGGESSAERVDQ